MIVRTMNVDDLHKYSMKGALKSGFPTQQTQPQLSTMHSLDSGQLVRLNDMTSLDSALWEQVLPFG